MNSRSRPLPSVDCRIVNGHDEIRRPPYPTKKVYTPSPTRGVVSDLISKSWK